MRQGYFATALPENCAMYQGGPAKLTVGGRISVGRSKGESGFTGAQGFDMIRRASASQTATVAERPEQ